MTKYTFSYRTEWSDRSEYSPQTVGQLPEDVLLPNGERVSLAPDERWQRPSRAGYITIHPDVRVRYAHWGDDGPRRMGRAGGHVDILAPKGSHFSFVTRCPGCGDETGRVSENGLLSNGRAPDNWHKDCAWEYKYDR